MLCHLISHLHICTINYNGEIKQIKMKIKKEVLQKVAESPALRKKLMSALSVSPASITRYLADNDDNLTKAAALKVIGEYFNLSNEEILEPENVAA